MTDHDLLLQFSRDRSHEAFAQLVRRHVDWLHSAALRLVHDPALAQDVTQAVLVVLAKKAPSLGPATPLAPWLFRVLQYVASNARRAAARRKNYEREAAAMHPSFLTPQDVPDWADVAPLLEPAVNELSSSDRAAILLRFYQQLSLPDVGHALGISEEAARKRVTRAVDRLRALITRKRTAQAAVPAAALAALLLQNTTHAAPPALASAAAGLGAGVASAHVLSLSQGVLAMMLRSQLKLLAACLATLAIASLLGVAFAMPGAQPPATTAAAGTPSALPAASAATAPGNPLYAAWKGQEGKLVTFDRKEIITGGAPVAPGQVRPPFTSTITFALADFTADHATIKTGAADTFTIPAAFTAADPASPKPAGTEELKIGDKTYACTKYTYVSTSPAEIGRNPQGLSARITVWIADGVPGGIVQRHISLTIRVSYDITDTLSVK